MNESRLRVIETTVLPGRLQLAPESRRLVDIEHSGVEKIVGKDVLLHPYDGIQWRLVLDVVTK